MSAEAEDLAHMRSTLEEVKTALAIHDQRVEFNVARMADANERLVGAIEKISEATTAIRSLAESKNGVALQLNPKTVAWIIGGIAGAGSAVGIGSELAHRMFHAMTGIPK